MSEREMKTEQLLEHILSACSEITKDEISVELEKRRKKTGGLISDATLLRMIAVENGIDIEPCNSKLPRLSIADLVPNLNDVTIIGRVIAVFEARSFEGRRKGKFASFLIADASGVLRVVSWNDRAELLESEGMEAGQIVKIAHGYTKEGQRGVELHMGRRSEIDVNPRVLNPDVFPTAVEFAAEIRHVLKANGSSRVNVVGTVNRISSLSAFEREDSSIGKVLRFSLMDHTGEIPVVVWNEKANELAGELSENAELLIVNGRVKRIFEGSLELHVDSSVYAELLPQSERFLKIADLTDGLGCVNVQGRVATKPAVRHVRTTLDESVRLAGFELLDETAKIWVSAWRSHANIADNLLIGDRIAIKNAYVRKGFADQLEISTRETTSIEVLNTKLGSS